MICYYFISSIIDHFHHYCYKGEYGTSRKLLSRWSSPTAPPHPHSPQGPRTLCWRDREIVRRTWWQWSSWSTTCLSQDGEPGGRVHPDWWVVDGEGAAKLLVEEPDRCGLILSLTQVEIISRGIYNCLISSLYSTQLLTWFKCEICKLPFRLEPFKKIVNSASPKNRPCVKKKSCN